MYTRLTLDQRLIELITTQKTAEIKRHLRLSPKPYLLDVPKILYQGLYETYMRFAILEGAFAAAKTLFPYCDNPSAPNSVGETVGELLLKRADEGKERVLADENYVALCRQYLCIGGCEAWWEPLNTLLNTVPDYVLETADYDDGYEADVGSDDASESDGMDELTQQLAQTCKSRV